MYFQKIYYFKAKAKKKIITTDCAIKIYRQDHLSIVCYIEILSISYVLVLDNLKCSQSNGN